MPTPVERMIPDPAVKRCRACERVFTLTEWGALKFVGLQPTETEGGAPATLELRNCHCGSTIGLEHECNGHPAGPFDPMGETVYCDGSCRVRR